MLTLISSHCAVLFQRLLVITLTVLAFVFGDSLEADESTAGEQQFKVLEGRYTKEQGKVLAEIAKVSDQTQQGRLIREHDPANTMIEEFLKLEEQHRGTLLGLSILHNLVSVASSRFGFNEDMPATNGGRRALKILTDHYADHPDLDVLFNWFCNDPAGEVFPKRALLSTHRHVRGTARYALATKRKAESWVANFGASAVVRCATRGHPAVSN